MKSGRCPRHPFLPCVFCALTFALAFFAPISAFSDFNGDKAAITNAKSIETAKITLMKAVENLAADWKDKVNKSVRDKAIRDAKAASEKTYSAEDVADLRRKADAAKENETSLENRMLGGLTMAATGIGGMQMMQGIAEMNADKAADAEMRSYLSTIICGIGGGKSVPYENTGSSPEDPGQLFTARRKYMELAGKTKSAKEVLGMAPGIESELIADTSRLYQNRGTDTDGINRALGEDYVSERAEANSGRDRALIGGGILAAGVIGGVVGDGLINEKGLLGNAVKERRQREADREEWRNKYRNLMLEKIKTEVEKEKLIVEKLKRDNNNTIPPPLDPTYGRGYGDVAPAARSAIFQKLRSPYNASALVSFLESNELFKYLTENEQVAWINKHTAEELDSIW